jgi:hypothetical protein
MSAQLIVCWRLLTEVLLRFYLEPFYPSSHPHFPFSLHIVSHYSSDTAVIHFHLIRKIVVPRNDWVCDTLRGFLRAPPYPTTAEKVTVAVTTDFVLHALGLSPRRYKNYYKSDISLFPLYANDEWVVIAQSILPTGWTTEGSEFEFLRAKNFHFSISSRSALGSTQPPIQWVLGQLLRG